MGKKKIICAITLGDPSGVGPEIILKALRNKEIRALAQYLIIADGWVLKQVKNTLYPSGFEKYNIIDLHNVPKSRFSFGKIKPEYGLASMEYISLALKLIKAGKAGCLVTAPISKEAINMAGYKFPGHTEYIAKNFSCENFAMMMLNDKLRVVLVTRHIALKDVAVSLSAKKILDTIKITHSGLKSFFAVKNPRLIACGLNPHNSDNGLIGSEEKRYIIPAVKAALNHNIDITGPFAADTIFQRVQGGNFDAVICMYHDQALIPLKLLGFNKAVNITLGLPFVRTSCGHGTAFDIAGTGKACEESFIEAIKLALKCTQNLKNR